MEIQLRSNAMTIDLSKTVFVNDIFSAMLPDGGTIVLNVVNESITSSAYTGEQAIKGVNINLFDVNGNEIDCPCVIGLGNDVMQITTEYKEYEGEMLTPDNMMYCMIEIYE